MEQQIPDQKACAKSVLAIRDALDTINGKWKLPIFIVLRSGPKQFNELVRSIEGITPKLLSKELRNLEINGFITRTVYPVTPAKVEYALTEYSDAFGRITGELKNWGLEHRKHIIGK